MARAELVGEEGYEWKLGRTEIPWEKVLRAEKWLMEEEDDIGKESDIDPER